MPTIQLRQLQYHYREVGAGTPTGAPTVVMLHGFTGSSENWLPIARHLNTRVILPDLIGHGLTESPADAARYSMTQAAQDIAALIQAVSSNKPIVLVGYSMGGRLALYLTLAAPKLVHSLFLESASPGLATAAEREKRVSSDEALADGIEQHGIAAFVKYWEALPLFASQRRLPKPAQDALRTQRLRNHPIGLANSLRGMGTGAQPSLWNHLDKLKLPVTLLAGEADAKFVQVNQAMSAQIPHAALYVVAEAGHAIHLEQPEAYLRLLRSALP